MSANTNLHKAKVQKNDEFYTQLIDVEKELIHYKHHFKNKTVFCNCDDSKWSAFWKYFHLNFGALGLKKLIATHYEKTNPTYKMEYTGGDDNNIKIGVATPLMGNGDFRSKECLDILNEADIVVTNPPFSFAIPFITTLINHNKQFLVIGDVNWITDKEIFPLIKDNKIWLGNNTVKEFIQPDGSIQKFGNKLWFTNLDHEKHHKKLELKKRYDQSVYPTYINYDAIDIKSVADIPIDYKGKMGVPITFLRYYNPDEFEIIGCTKINRNELGIKRLGETWLNAYLKNGGTGHYTANMNIPVYFDRYGVPKSPFSKIIIRRKHISDI